MALENMELVPATEAVQYPSMRDNYVYRNQRSIYLPKGDKTPTTDGVVYMLSPSKEDSMDIINGNYALFYKCGYRIYTTQTRYAEKVGSHQIRGNKRQEYRKEFMDNRTNNAIRFKNPDEIKNLANKILSNPQEVISVTKVPEQLRCFDAVYNKGVRAENRVFMSTDFLKRKYINE